MTPIPEDIDEETAAALDRVLDDLHAGRPIDRDGLVLRFPGLAEPLDVLLRLGQTVTTVLNHTDVAPGPAPTLNGRIGPYTIERELGSGGFGSVYLAFDCDLKRRVALKVLHSGRLDQPEALQRFHREARVTAHLRHPGIVQLYEYSREGPPHYLVTEYIDGTDPCSWCRERSADFKGIAELLSRVAETVEYAHQQGVCHRDLKPANIIVDGAGQPHILDFGLARVYRESLAVSAPTSDGRVLGSLVYMAPEQAAGQSNTADARSDVYSLGVILFELLTGKLPFEGPVHELLTQVLDAVPPSPRDLSPKIPRKLEAICVKAMARRPDDRYASAGALAADLRAFLGGEHVEAHKISWLTRLTLLLGRRHHDIRRSGWTLLLTALGLTILAGCLVANYWELTLPAGQRWPFILGTKAVQIALMLFWTVRLRPTREPRLTATEKQIWSLVFAYYGGSLSLSIANIFLDEPIRMAPVLAVLSGMGFISLGTTIWGWFYVWGAGFFALTILIAIFAPYGLSILGVGWFLALVVGANHLRTTR